MAFASVVRLFGGTQATTFESSCTRQTTFKSSWAISRLTMNNQLSKALIVSIHKIIWNYYNINRNEFRSIYNNILGIIVTDCSSILILTKVELLMKTIIIAIFNFNTDFNTKFHNKIHTNYYYLQNEQLYFIEKRW